MLGGTSTAFTARQTAMRGRLEALERWLDRERDQLVLWMPVMLGTGIAAWFILLDERGWWSIIAGGLALMLGGFAFRREHRTATILKTAGLCLALGCALMWVRAVTVAAPVLTKPQIASFTATIERVEAQTAKERFRLLLRPEPGSALPPRVRVTVKAADIDRKLVSGDRITLRARLVPPPEASVPGGYDFARTAWFLGLGATGSAMGAVTHVDAADGNDPTLRERLSAHVRSKIEGSAGGIAAAFASGDRGGISVADEESMRASGLTHLLSISGLHITAVVAATMFITLKLLALSPWLALRAPLLVASAGVGALAGIGYTVLTGAEVPTIRSCIAAVLVLIGLALGREAITLRLVATGALIVLLLWPESVIGPSFQLSFAAIAAIVALHEYPLIQKLTMRREEGVIAGLGRGLLSLLVTGIAVEAALAPIALFHFHKSGLYGALANIVAIPLTTFIVMPVEALALVFDTVGAGAPFWWLTAQSLELLLWLSRTVASLPGAVAALPSVPNGAFGLIVGGGLWAIIWKSRVRAMGFIPFIVGVIWSVMTPAPDILVTGDGKHMAMRGTGGEFALLRPRAGDYVRDTLGEALGATETLTDLDVLIGADCGRDMCTVSVKRDTRTWRIAATRSGYFLPWTPFMAACSTADIIISDRTLPHKCRARWIKADRDLLRQTGGLSINLENGNVRTVKQRGDRHPWVLARGNGNAKP